ncbi:hypothetical protein JQ604_03700 [Bradyrhizobium jicamae]|nr:hypothetical protein [Bradyrhizobium jicamae]MBR0751277.1 hypothetical protein [Bradyrhizobium jicamae]
MTKIAITGSTIKILVSHMLKNAVLPTITVIGAQFGFLFGGTLLVRVAA